MKKRFKQSVKLLSKAAKKFKKDDPVRLAGTTAYFAIFAMAPIIIIIVSATGLLLGQEEIQQKIFIEIDQLIGNQGTEYIEELVKNYQGTTKNLVGTIVGFIIFIFTSTTFFTVLQKSLNHIWRIRVKPSSGLLKLLYDRLLSLGLILSLGFILLVSLLIDTALAILKDYINSVLPDITVSLLEIGNVIISFGVILLIFALIYKFLPDVKIKWKVTWMGSLITTILFFLGKWLIGIAIANSNIGVMYGAAGSLVVILLWIFYSSLIFFFGAEITQQYAEMFSHTIEPQENAVKIEINEVKDK
ncbi:MAG: YihY/virulence factor BrkB family protein [Bacteroidetes bacterium]|nr:YihY/virulence factor BrkB family protein [Bacteroidota bacterium]